MIASSYNSAVQPAFITYAQQENEAEVNADIEQENKCKKDTECENENELNNSLNILNKTETVSGTEPSETGQLTVTKIVRCEIIEPESMGISNSVFHKQPSLTNIQFVPTGNGGPCHDSEITSQFEPQDFEFTVTGNNPNPSTFPGSSSGVVVTLGTGPYDVEEYPSNVPPFVGGNQFKVSIQTTESGDCTGNIAPGDSKTCTFTNDVTLEEQEDEP